MRVLSLSEEEGPMLHGAVVRWCACMTKGPSPIQRCVLATKLWTTAGMFCCLFEGPVSWGAHGAWGMGHRVSARQGGGLLSV